MPGRGCREERESLRDDGPKDGARHARSAGDVRLRGVAREAGRFPGLTERAGRGAAGGAPVRRRSPGRGGRRRARAAVARGFRRRRADCGRDGERGESAAHAHRGHGGREQRGENGRKSASLSHSHSKILNPPEPAAPVHRRVASSGGDREADDLVRRRLARDELHVRRREPEGLRDHGEDLAVRLPPLGRRLHGELQGALRGLRERAIARRPPRPSGAAAFRRRRP